MSLFVARDRALPSTWRSYSRYLRIHPSAVISSDAALTCFGSPAEGAVILEIGEGSLVEGNLALVRPSAKIVIGKRCMIGKATLVAADHIEVRDDSIVSQGAFVLDSDNHAIAWQERQFDVERFRRGYVETGGKDPARYHDWSPVKISKVTVGPKAWIALNAVVLRGATIGEGSVVGAGSVVTKSVADWHVAAGNPAREIRRVDGDVPR